MLFLLVFLTVLRLLCLNVLETTDHLGISNKPPPWHGKSLKSHVVFPCCDVWYIMNINWSSYHASAPLTHWLAGWLGNCIGVPIKVAIQLRNILISGSSFESKGLRNKGSQSTVVLMTGAHSRTRMKALSTSAFVQRSRENEGGRKKKKKKRKLFVEYPWLDETLHPAPLLPLLTLLFLSRLLSRSPNKPPACG